MPYIREEIRSALGHGEDARTSGELNYCITCEVLKYLGIKGESYQTYNDIMGALECCKQELYRRKISKYEDTKIESNGDVY